MRALIFGVLFIPLYTGASTLDCKTSLKEKTHLAPDLNAIQHLSPDPMKKDVIQFLTSIKGKSVTLIGDLMMDENARGNEAGMVPDGAHPYVVIGSTEYLPGGAANAAMNLRALGLNVKLIGVIGDDSIGKKLIELLKDSGVDTSGILVDKNRPTTHKQRIWMSGQQMIRIDSESTEKISEDIEARLLTQVRSNLSDSILLSDYGKGVLTKSLSLQVLQWAEQNQMPSIVDPKGNDYSKYQNATVVKPNQSEALKATGRRDLKSEEEIFEIASQIQQNSGIGNVLISRSEKGMILQSVTQRKYQVPTHARQVSDVVGAGDTVVASLAAGLAAHLPLEIVMQIANLAAGIKVRDHHGVYAVTAEDLEKEVGRTP